MKFSDYTFLKEEVESGGLTDNVKAYIDSKFEAIEQRISDIGGGSRYNVIPAGEGLLDIIDIDKQTVAGKLSFQGDLISSPIVHGNKVSFGIQKTSGENKTEVLGVIYELPSGTNIGNFRVEQSDPDTNYQTVMGVSETEVEQPIDDVESIDDVEDDTTDVETTDGVEDASDVEPQITPNQLDDLKADISTDISDIKTSLSDREQEIARLKAREDIRSAKKDKSPEKLSADDI